MARGLMKMASRECQELRDCGNREEEEEKESV